MYTQQIICAGIAIRATAGTEHERPPRTNHNPQSLSAFTYRPPAQQLSKYATTNLLTYRTLARSDTVVSTIPQPTGLYTSPVVRPFPSIFHTLRARTIRLAYSKTSARAYTSHRPPQETTHLWHEGAITQCIHHHRQHGNTRALALTISL